MSARFTLVQLTLAGYRREFVAGLRDLGPGEVVIAAGRDYFDRSITRGVPDDHVDVDLRNRFLMRRRLAVQRGVWPALRGSRTWVLELNPRILTVWWWTLVGRVTGRRVFLWGHLLGRRHGDERPRLARQLMVRLATGVVAYTEADAEGFRRYFPRARVVLGANAVDRADALAPAGAEPGRHFLTIGRLAPAKRVDLLVDGFAEACRAERLPVDTRLVIVGSGESEADVVAAVARSGVADRIDLIPGTFDPGVLEQHYGQAMACVCGGYVGLNITQSLARGIPFVYPLHSNHSPEVSLARPGHNAWPFDPSTPEAVADALVAVHEATAAGRVDRRRLQQETLSVYSVEQMVQGFLGVTKP